MEPVYQIQNKKGEWVDYEPGIVSDGKLQELKSEGKFREKPAELPQYTGRLGKPADQDATRTKPRGFGDGNTPGWRTFWDLANPFAWTEKADNLKNKTERLIMMPLAAAADVGMLAFSPFRMGYSALKGAAAGTRLGKPARAMGNWLKNDINAVSKSRNAGTGFLNRAENAAVGAADAMLASGDISPEAAAIGGFFGGWLGGNAANNAMKAEKEFIKFARAPSYQQRWAKDYLKSRGLDIKESPQAVRELVKMEMKAGETLESAIAKNESRLDKLNDEMSSLLHGTQAGKIPLGMKFSEFSNDIKHFVYEQGRDIGSSEGRKLEEAIGEIMKDIRIAQLEKKMEKNGMSLMSAREHVERNLDALLDGMPLTLQDADELKRAMQKRTSMYKRSSAAQARAGVETMANAEGSRAINRELDLLKDIPPEIMEQGRMLKEKLGDANLEILNGAMDLKAANLSEKEQNILKDYLRGSSLQQYRTINRERSDLIGKNDIFETMLAKFEFSRPDENFVPKGKPAGKNKSYSFSSSTAARMGHRTAESVRGSNDMDTGTAGEDEKEGRLPIDSVPGIRKKGGK